MLASLLQKHWIRLFITETSCTTYIAKLLINSKIGEPRCKIICTVINIQYNNEGRF